ncbi:MAG: flagellar basal body rod protein FlgB [Limnohabitans sp.]|jgi:flagellar basal-body rod protein FlgB
MSLFDSALGLHGQALSARSRRVEVIARNIANADTPHYKAQDLDFKQVLKASSDQQLRTTQNRHFDVPAPGAAEHGVLYRVPFNSSFDGNTVEMNIEQAQYGKAAAEYQATLSFFQNSVSGLRKALRGD